MKRQRFIVIAGLLNLIVILLMMPGVLPTPLMFVILFIFAISLLKCVHSLNPGLALHESLKNPLSPVEFIHHG